MTTLPNELERGTSLISRGKTPNSAWRDKRITSSTACCRWNGLKQVFSHRCVNSDPVPLLYKPCERGNWDEPPTLQESVGVRPTRTTQPDFDFDTGELTKNHVHVSSNISSNSCKLAYIATGFRTTFTKLYQILDETITFLVLNEGRIVLGTFRSERMRVLNRSRQDDHQSVMLN
ncbi:hypothetical protein TNCV_1215231 [Trichonephila clavipes]|nr:hypothetical protein TNCV_1215231 [Trichonephila clavipes]